MTPIPLSWTEVQESLHHIHSVIISSELFNNVPVRQTLFKVECHPVIFIVLNMFSEMLQHKKDRHIRTWEILFFSTLWVLNGVQQGTNSKWFQVRIIGHITLAAISGTTILVYYLQLILTHWGLVTPFGDIELGHHWLRQRLVAWRHQAITWTNID